MCGYRHAAGFVFEPIANQLDVHIVQQIPLMPTQNQSFLFHD